MNINLSHPGLDTRRKKKFIRECLYRFNWIKVSEESEWIWASIESEKEIRSFIQWIAEQPIEYPARVNALKSYVIKNSEKQGMKLRCKNHELVSSR